jgi:hypothetical protein
VRGCARPLLPLATVTAPCRALRAGITSESSVDEGGDVDDSERVGAASGGSGSGGAGDGGALTPLMSQVVLDEGAMVEYNVVAQVLDVRVRCMLLTTQRPSTAVVQVLRSEFRQLAQLTPFLLVKESRRLVDTYYADRCPGLRYLFVLDTVTNEVTAPALPKPRAECEQGALSLEDVREAAYLCVEQATLERERALFRRPFGIVAYRFVRKPRVRDKTPPFRVYAIFFSELTSQQVEQNMDRLGTLVADHMFGPT